RIRLANRQRRDRLEAWRQDRLQSPMPIDPILSWIEEQLRRLQREPAEPSPLILIEIDSRIVRSQSRQTEARRRMLRQAWIAGLENPETQNPENLSRLLEGRGFAPVERDAARIDSLVGP